MVASILKRDLASHRVRALQRGKTMRQILIALGFCALAAPAFAAPVPMDSPRWELLGAETRVETFQGQQALYLRGAIATLADANFDTGVIEFDMAITSNAQSFPGIYFRGVDENNYEHFYIRPHQSGNPDSMQYTPVINGNTAWQIHSQYNARMRFRVNEWFHVRLEVAEDSARIFVDSNEPSMIVYDLKRDRAAGYIQLRGSLGGMYVANFSVTPGSPAAAPAEPVPENIPAGLVRTWQVSAPMAEADAFAAASANRLNNVSWTALPVETNGLANLARVGVRTNEAPTVLTRVSVRSDRARSVPMRFGFSDKVRVYVNGTLLYSGDDTQNSRDYRFLGTIGWWDALQLPLRRGNNEIVFAVSEGGGGNAIGGGGWSATAAFPEMAGLTVAP
ncbi:hypothetical protein U91I_00332 [alpha proteobacterium U9-1i]|nr:hypothetical protein U91I_00332 [alpha proteobacterium U9-1i]